MPPLPYSIPKSCDPTGEKIFIANIRLRKYEERDPVFSPPATMLLQIDVIASPDCAGVIFRDVRLLLEILSPSSALFVGFSERKNDSWEVPHSDFPSVWVNKCVAVPTRQLRHRLDQESLLRPGSPLDGRTFRIGIAGLDTDENFQFTAFVDGYSTPATHRSCLVTIETLRIGDDILGYIPDVFFSGDL